jgi:hypothetical protein
MLMAVRELPRILRERQPVPGRLEIELRLLERTGC